VTGTVRYTLRQGAMDISSIKANRPLYLTDRDAWEKALVQDAFVPPVRTDRAVREEAVAV